MSLFEMPEFDAHEQVVFGHDAACGLKAIIAVHSTVLGPQVPEVAVCGLMHRPRKP